jgi:hypothetical protein
MFIENPQYSIGPSLQRQSIFTYINDTTISLQKGVIRMNCIDCLDRTNNVQLTIGLTVLAMQLDSLKRRTDYISLCKELRDMWINNGDHISRIYTGTGALGQRSKVRIFSFNFSIRIIVNHFQNKSYIISRQRIFNVVLVVLYKIIYVMMKNNNQCKH